MSPGSNFSMNDREHFEADCVTSEDLSHAEVFAGLLEYFSEEPVNLVDPDLTIRQRMTDRDICESVASPCIGNSFRRPGSRRA